MFTLTHRNISIPVVDAVDGLDALQDVVDQAVDQILTRLNGKALVANILQRDHLCSDLYLHQLLERDVPALPVIGAVRLIIKQSFCPLAVLHPIITLPSLSLAASSKSSMPTAAT